MELFRTFVAGLIVGGVSATIATTLVISLCMIAGDADERAGYK